jgi:hypothetical protein
MSSIAGRMRFRRRRLHTPTAIDLDRSVNTGS